MYVLPPEHDLLPPTSVPVRLTCVALDL